MRQPWRQSRFLRLLGARGPTRFAAALAVGGHLDTVLAHIAVNPDAIRLPLALSLLQPLAGGLGQGRTRQASGDGYHATELVCRDLIQRGFCINSGLALGIDSFAHHFTLAEGGRTQGFVAHGLDRCYPSAHYGLMRSLSEQGAVISPFPLGTEPYKVNFLRRNALMSLWSKEVILIEAGIQSGALNTAEHAIRQGRPLWAVSGRPGSKACAGSQKLLTQGLAKPYPVALDHGNETPVLALLRNAPMSIEALADVLKVPLTRLEQTLLEHERELKVVYLPDGRWHYRGW